MRACLQSRSKHWMPMLSGCDALTSAIIASSLAKSLGTPSSAPSVVVVGVGVVVVVVATSPVAEVTATAWATVRRAVAADAASGSRSAWERAERPSDGARDERWILCSSVPSLAQALLRGAATGLSGGWRAARRTGGRGDGGDGRHDGGRWEKSGTCGETEQRSRPPVLVGKPLRGLRGLPLVSGKYL